MTLPKQADAKIDLGGVLLCSGKYGRAAFRTKRLNSLGATFRHLHIVLGLALEQESLRARGNHHSKGRAAEFLTVCAMANHNFVRIYCCSELN